MIEHNEDGSAFNFYAMYCEFYGDIPTDKQVAFFDEINLLRPVKSRQLAAVVIAAARIFGK